MGSISYYIAINLNNNNNYSMTTANLKLGISRAKVVNMVTIRGKREYVSNGFKD